MLAAQSKQMVSLSLFSVHYPLSTLEPSYKILNVRWRKKLDRLVSGHFISGDFKKLTSDDQIKDREVFSRTIKQKPHQDFIHILVVKIISSRRKLSETLSRKNNETFPEVEN